MRCPKCGYITFDKLEKCTKCKKNISKFSEKLSGTVSLSESPAFLQFEIEEPEPEVMEEQFAEEQDEDIEMDLATDEEDREIEFELSPSDDDEVKFDLDEDTSLDLNDDDDDDFSLDLDGDDDLSLSLDDDDELSLDDDGSDLGDDLDLGLDDDGPELSDDLDLGLDLGLDDDGPELSKDLDLGLDSDKEEAQGEKAPSLDLDDIDISDLGPPSEDKKKEVGGLSLESESKASSGGLGDLAALSMDGLDLDAPTPPPAGSATGKKMRPTAKTGTALDSFDFDLGNLTSDEKK